MATRWRAKLLIKVPGNRLIDDRTPDATYSSPTRTGAIAGILGYAVSMTDDDTERFKIIVEKKEI